jgi:hypothetical protein
MCPSSRNSRVYITSYLHDRYPEHSLLRFLLVSNSLDLILDVFLEMWSATAGTIPILFIASYSICYHFDRLYSSLCPATNTLRPRKAHPLSPARCFQVDCRCFCCSPLLCTSRSLSAMAYPPMLRAHARTTLLRNSSQGFNTPGCRRKNWERRRCAGRLGQNC